VKNRVDLLLLAESAVLKPLIMEQQSEMFAEDILGMDLGL
jgi:hypothetical protein